MKVAILGCENSHAWTFAQHISENKKYKEALEKFSNIELEIYKLKSKLPNTLMIGVGGSFDVWSGKTKRAPLFFRKIDCNKRMSLKVSHPATN